MLNGWWRRIRGGKKKRPREIDPDEILIDSSNVPQFDRDQFEGRIERPLSRKAFTVAGLCAVLLALGLLFRAGDLQILAGPAYAQEAKDNQLTEQVIFADRGVITDRNGIPLAYNVATSTEQDFPERVYAPYVGLAHVVGYVKPPAEDSSGNYYRTDFEGLDGVEQAYNSELSGENGLKLTETNAQGKVVAESTIEPPQNGQEITLSIDAGATQELYQLIQQWNEEYHYQGGAAVIMDVHTGQLLAMTSYPEYSQTAMMDGDASAIAAYNADPDQPFLDRATEGLYPPGSTIKTVDAVGALMENLISPTTQILSTGSISLPNPYDPSHPYVFLDWRANGWVDMEQALSVSSDVYFYEVGGGYQSQPGLGITGLDKYYDLFGLGKVTGLAGFPEAQGTVPTPAWKAINFPSDPTWRIGDTYHTAIGQYGVQVTPLQEVRIAAAIANGGYLVTPTLLASTTGAITPLNVSSSAFQIVGAGMRMGVTTGISWSLGLPFVEIAAKTGTAQVGVNNAYETEWVIGFWPYQDPEYAFAMVLDRTPTGQDEGAAGAMSAFFKWMDQNEPQYLGETATSSPSS